MANFKHKVFLLIAKWIPVAVAAGILINNTLAMLDIKDVILDLFDITVGSSLAFVIMMYACSYRTCRMITGEVVLPNTPTVTGYPAYNPYSCPAQSAPAPAN